MPLTQISLTSQVTWTQQKTNTGFLPTKQGPSSETFALTSLDVDDWNQLYATDLSLAASATSTIDLTSLTNLVGESFSFAHVLAVWVQASGSTCKIEPGATNGLELFGGTGQAVIVPSGGINLFSYATTGIVVDSTHKTLKFTNPGGTTLTAGLVIIGSTT